MTIEVTILDAQFQQVGIDEVVMPFFGQLPFVSDTINPVFPKLVAIAEATFQTTPDTFTLAYQEQQTVFGQAIISATGLPAPLSTQDLFNPSNSDNWFAGAGNATVQQMVYVFGDTENPARNFTFTIDFGDVDPTLRELVTEWDEDRLLSFSPIINGEVVAPNGITEIGDAGNNLLEGTVSDDELRGAGGNDTLVGGAGDDLLVGGPGADEARGGNGNDTVNGGDGNDLLKGGGGADNLNGGAGDDTLEGGMGADNLIGAVGNDRILGNQGNDTLLGGGGDDTLGGGGGSDDLRGGAGNDRLVGGNGRDTLLGGDGKDTLSGGNGNDSLVGGAGNDLMNGGNLNDELRGGNGRDTLNAGDGNDTLLGGGGRDILNGGAGNDDMSGGGGGDRFVFLVAQADGDDTVRLDDYDDMATFNDVIILRGFGVTGWDDSDPLVDQKAALAAAGITATESNGDWIIDLNGAGTVLVDAPNPISEEMLFASLEIDQ